MGELHRILVTDDEPVVRDTYRAFFSPSTEFDVCGEARDGAEAVEAYARLQPDVVLMDLDLPVLPGIEATRQICARWPAACVVAMTTFGTREHVVAALRAGAAGYLLKDVGGAGLLDGLRAALAGDMPLSGSVRRELVSSVRQEPLPGPVGGVTEAGVAEVVLAEVGLTDRERELLSWLAQGLGNVQIGGRLYVSEGSVKQSLVSIGRKLGVRSRTGILVRAIQLGLVDPHALPPLTDS